MSQADEGPDGDGDGSGDEEENGTRKPRIARSIIVMPHGHRRPAHERVSRLCLDVRTLDSFYRFARGESFICAYCKQDVDYLRNIGTWGCSYHPKEIRRADGSFDCCGLEPRTRHGCCPCDHRTFIHDRPLPIIMTREILDRLPVRPNRVIDYYRVSPDPNIEDKEDELIVVRCSAT